MTVLCQKCKAIDLHGLEPMKVFMTMIYDDMVVKNGAGKEVHFLNRSPWSCKKGWHWTRL